MGGSALLASAVVPFHILPSKPKLEEQILGHGDVKYKNGKLKLMLQDQTVFKNCHDVCVDGDKNLYVCQWNANGVYPYKLHRI